MKTIKMVLGGLLWPVVLLFSGQMLRISIMILFAVGIGIWLSLIKLLFLMLDAVFLSPVEIGTFCLVVLLVVVNVFFYILAYRKFLLIHGSVGKSRYQNEGMDNDTKPMSDLGVWWCVIKVKFLRFWRKAGLWFSDRKSINQDSKMTEIIKTLKVMDEHAKRARVLWARSQGGGGFSHFL